MEVSNRAYVEKQVQSAVNRAFKAPRAASGNRQPGWATLKRELIDEIQPHLEKIQLDAIRAMYARYGDGPAPPHVKPNADKRANDLADDLIAVSKKRWAKMKKPRTPDDIKAWRRENFGNDRAKNIAITETTIANTAGEMIAWKALKKSGNDLEGYWVTEQNPCAFCAEMKGQPAAVWKRTYPAGPPSPHPGCVLGITPVLVPNGITAVLAQYEGPIVRIETASGSDFTVTPNHMLLCDCGFVRATDFVDGVNILRSSAGQRKVASNPDNYWQPPTAKEVFCASLVAGGMVSTGVPVSSEHLHGDGAFAEGNIDIVNMECFLRDETKTKLAKVLAKLGFVLGLLGKSLNGLCTCDLRRRRYSGTDQGLISTPRESFALVAGQAIHSNGARLTSIANLEPKELEIANYAATRHSQIISHFLNAMPEVISCDKVIRVERDRSHGKIPVYDFETESSLYVIGNGLISSNCRCSIAWEPK